MTERDADRQPDPPGSGILVIESPPGEEPIPLRRETVTAFVGPAPRGPAHIPIAIESVAEFRRRFGSPSERSRLEWMLGQYFDNGGRAAIVVRVPRSGGPNRIALPGPGGTLGLVARNPGPLEYLRAAVDYDGIPPGDLWRFNLTVQRVRSPSNPLVEEQEVWRNVTVIADDESFVGDALADSALARIDGEPPRSRPNVTIGGGGSRTSSAVPGYPGYVNSQGDWRSSPPPTDYDLVGSERESTGLHALDQIPHVDLVCLLSGAPDADVGPVGLFVAERYCSRRNAILLVDPPFEWAGVQDVTRRQVDSILQSPNVMTYFPRLAEPGLDGRAHQPLSALGAIAGMLAARDRDRLQQGAASHVHDDEPVLIRSRARVVVEPDEEDVALLARRGVNVLRPAAPGFVAFHGHVTLARSGSARREWQHLDTRRRAVMTASNIARSTRWAAVQAREPATWKAVAAQISRYLEDTQEAGLLASARDRRAFYVKCDQDTNGRRGGLSFVVGLALERPDDFVAFRFDHDMVDCRVTEVSWQPGRGLVN